MCALIKLIRKKSAVAWNLRCACDLPSQREESVGIGTAVKTEGMFLSRIWPICHMPIHRRVTGNRPVFLCKTFGHRKIHRCKNSLRIYPKVVVCFVLFGSPNRLSKKISPGPSKQGRPGWSRAKSNKSARMTA